MSSLFAAASAAAPSLNGALPGPAALGASPPLSCATAVSSVVVSGDGPLLRAAPPEAPAAEPMAQRLAAAGGVPSDYRQLVATTVLGRPRLDRWCVWIEPPPGDGAEDLWQSRWRSAVQRALSQWQSQLPIQLVEDPAAAQVRVWRRRPPLATGPDGRLRASHGRATLTLKRVRRGEVTRLEPSVEVLLSPAQRELAIEATALHELGHAFGLWGHSDDARDAMASVPGAQPVLTLSRRDLATLEWLYRQPTVFGQPLER